MDTKLAVIQCKDVLPRIRNFRESIDPRYIAAHKFWQF
jgi:hypothetical protein